MMLDPSQGDVILAELGAERAGVLREISAERYGRFACALACRNCGEPVVEDAAGFVHHEHPQPSRVCPAADVIEVAL